MRVPETTPGAKADVATGRLMIHHQINHKALETLAMARSRRPYTQVNLLLLLLQEQGDFLLASTPTGDEEPYDMRETLRSLAKMEEAQVVPLLSIHLHNVYPKGRRAYSLLQTTMEPLSHGLWSCLPASH